MKQAMEMGLGLLGSSLQQGGGLQLGKHTRPGTQQTSSTGMSSGLQLGKSTTANTGLKLGQVNVQPLGQG